MTTPSDEGPRPLAGRTLDEVLGESQAAGFIGPGELTPHVAQAAAFAAACAVLGLGSPSRVLDLGSGGGLPGLVLLERWPGAAFTLLDASEQRTDFLARAVRSLGASDRVEVVRGRAEALAHEVRLRATFDLVLVRSFGAPALVAECGGAFLSPGGRMLVSEPPGSDGSRWAGVEEAGLGLRREPVVATSGFVFQPLRNEDPFPASRPRRVGVPAKRPLF